MTHPYPDPSSPTPALQLPNGRLLPTLVMGVRHRLPCDSAPSSLSLTLSLDTLERITSVALAAASLEDHGERIHVIDTDWPDLQCSTDVVRHAALTRDGHHLDCREIPDSERSAYKRKPRPGSRTVPPYSESVLTPAGYRPDLSDLRWEKGKSGLRITARTLCTYAWDRRSDVRVISERLFLHDLYAALRHDLTAQHPSTPHPSTPHRIPHPTPGLPGETQETA